MRIRKQTLAYFILSASIVSGVSSAYSAAPPKELWGKSLTITWSESREQRPLGEQDWRTVSGSTKVLAYISDVGRIFSTGTTTTAGGTAQLDPRILASKGNISAVFSGRTLVLAAAVAKHVRRITVDFDQNFAGCTGRVVFAKQAGAEISQEYSNIIKRMNEVKAAQIGGVSCSIQTGNILAR